MSAILNTGALAGKVVFVTGASRGIGSDICISEMWPGIYRLLGSERNFEFFDSSVFQGISQKCYLIILKALQWRKSAQ